MMLNMKGIPGYKEDKEPDSLGIFPLGYEELPPPKRKFRPGGGWVDWPKEAVRRIIKVRIQARFPRLIIRRKVKRKQGTNDESRI